MPADEKDTALQKVILAINVLYAPPDYSKFCWEGFQTGYDYYALAAILSKIHGTKDPLKSMRALSEDSAKLPPAEHGGKYEPPELKKCLHTANKAVIYSIYNELSAPSCQPTGERGNASLQDHISTLQKLQAAVASSTFANLIQTTKGIYKHGFKISDDSV